MSIQDFAPVFSCLRVLLGPYMCRCVCVLQQPRLQKRIASWGFRFQQASLWARLILVDSDRVGIYHYELQVT